MKRLLFLFAWLCLPTMAMAQNGTVGSTASPLVNSLGRPLSGVSVSICQPLATTAASVSSNVATLTMASNPQTAGFVAGMTILVSGFTGGDTYFNGGTFANGAGISNGFTVLSVTSTTITYSVTHANASASSNGTVLQQGNSTTSCAGLSSITSDPAGVNSATQPLSTDGLGNWAAFAAPGVYYVQFYGSAITTRVQQIAIACVPSSATGTCGVYLNGNNTFTGANNITAGVINNSCVVDGQKYTNIAAAYVGCPSNATIYVPSNQTISAGLTINTSGISIICLNNAQLTLSASAAMFTITGGHFTISGCILDGGSLAQQILQIQAADAIVEKNVFQNFGTGGTGSAVSISTSSAKNVIVYHNKLVSSTGSAFPIIGQTTVSNVLVDGNTVDMTAGTQANVNGIHFQAGSSALKIVNNDIYVGGGTAAEGIVVFANGGANPFDVTIASNRIKMTATGAGACLSVANATNYSVVGNRCDLGGFNMSNGAGTAFECVGSSYGNYTANTVVNWGGGANGAFSIQGCSISSWIGNVVSNFAVGTHIFYIQGFAGNLNASYDTFSGNTIGMSVVAASGFHFLSNNASATVLNNTVTGNVVQGTGIASSIGILLDFGSGTENGNTVSGNTVNNVDVAFKIVASVGNSLISNNQVSNIVTSTYNDAGTGTRIVDNVGIPFTSLGTPGNGSSVYCTTCLKASNPCSGSSTGTFADRINGAWVCR